MANIKDFDKMMNELNAREQEFKEHVAEKMTSFANERRAILEEKRRAKRSKEENFRQELAKDVARDYNMSTEQAEIIVDQAWDRGHGCGYREVTAFAHEYGEWVEKILDIQRNIDY